MNSDIEQIKEGFCEKFVVKGTYVAGYRGVANTSDNKDIVYALPEDIWKYIQELITTREKKILEGFVDHCEYLLSQGESRRFVKSGTHESGLSLVKTMHIYLAQQKEGK